jgi:hypothetical protein
MPDDIGIFVAEQLLAFRQRALTGDPHFFEVPENQAAYQAFVQALPYVWVGRQGQAAPAAWVTTGTRPGVP